MTRVSHSDSRQLILAALERVEQGERVILQRDGVDVAVVAPIQDKARLESEASGQADSKHQKPVWQRIVELGEAIPAAEMAHVPSDLSKNLDHYLYGAPRREE